MHPAMPVLRVPAAPAVAEVVRPGVAALQAVRLGLHDLLREATEAGLAGGVAPARTDHTEAVSRQPRVVERPRVTVD